MTERFPEAGLPLGRLHIDHVGPPFASARRMHPARNTNKRTRERRCPRVVLPRDDLLDDLYADKRADQQNKRKRPGERGHHVAVPGAQTPSIFRPQRLRYASIAAGAAAFPMSVSRYHRRGGRPAACSSMSSHLATSQRLASRACGRNGLRCYGRGRSACRSCDVATRRWCEDRRARWCCRRPAERQPGRERRHGRGSRRTRARSTGSARGITVRLLGGNRRQDQGSCNEASRVVFAPCLTVLMVRACPLPHQR
jgi:hypothetical protein